MKRLLVVGVVGTLVFAVAGVGYGAWRVAAQGQEHERQAAVMAGARVVDDQLTDVWSRLAGRDMAWDLSRNEPTSSLASMLDFTRSDVSVLAADVDGVRETVGEIPSDAVQAAYLEVCDELDAVLATALADAERAQPLQEAHALLTEARNNNSSGQREINASVIACNERRHTAAKEAAKKAEAEFVAMREAYVAARALASNSSIEQAYEYIDASIVLAQMQHELAVLGARGGVSSYNAQITKLDGQQDTVDSLADLPGAARSAVWVMAQDATAKLESRASHARALWDAARDLVTSGEG
jgi:flagellar basal body-associated protein FliL